MSIGIDEVTGSDSMGWDGSGTEFGCALEYITVGALLMAQAKGKIVS
jgi:hypothetical protein